MSTIELKPATADPTCPTCGSDPCICPSSSPLLSEHISAEEANERFEQGLRWLKIRDLPTLLSRYEGRDLLTLSYGEFRAIFDPKDGADDAETSDNLQRVLYTIRDLYKGRDVLSLSMLELKIFRVVLRELHALGLA